MKFERDSETQMDQQKKDLQKRRHTDTLIGHEPSSWYFECNTPQTEKEDKLFILMD